MSLTLPLFMILVLVAAFLYSSVGHGGGSAYLAILTLMGMEAAGIKPAALVLNIVVSIIAFVQFYRQGHFNRRLFLWLALASIPFAYLGGRIPVDTAYYKQLLGVLLFFAAARLAIPSTPGDEQPARSWSIPILLLMGAGIGFVSGLIGIGGGIILSPLLIFLGYADMKTTAGISALFIFVNSIAGLLGQVQLGFSLSPTMLIMLLLAIVGGLAGSWLGAKRLNLPVLKKVLATVLILAALKLVFV